MKAKLVLEAKPKNVSLARDWVLESCRQFGIKGRRVMHLKTITSEMVTNVVKHAYRDRKTKHFVLSLKLTANNNLIITVKDYGSGYVKSRSQSLHVGLIIVNSLADKVKISNFGLGCRVKAVIKLKDAEVSKMVFAKLRLIN